VYRRARHQNCRSNETKNCAAGKRYRPEISNLIVDLCHEKKSKMCHVPTLRLSWIQLTKAAARPSDNRPEFIGFDDIDRLISVPTQMGFDLGVTPDHYQ
jgi:hypothetical protein